MPELNENRRTFYDARWDEWDDMIRYSPAPRFRRTRIISWLKGIPCSSLLDVGCGNGEFLMMVQKELPGIKLAGADISQAVIDSNRSRIPEAEFHALDLNHETLQRRCDAVVCMEVVEHCVDYNDAIKRLADMTGKWLFLTVPCGPVFEIDRRVGHTQHFSAEEIRKAITDAGLKIVKLQRWGFPFFNLYKHAININPDRMTESFLSYKKYGMNQKILSLVTYAAFKLSLPFGGYQLFALASR